MRSIHLCQADNCFLMILDRPGSTRPTHLEVSQVPEDVTTVHVIRLVSSLLIFPWPTKPVPWSRIADLKAGSFLRGLATGDAA